LQTCTASKQAAAGRQGTHEGDNDNRAGRGHALSALLADCWTESYACTAHVVPQRTGKPRALLTQPSITRHAQPAGPPKPPAVHPGHARPEQGAHTALCNPSALPSCRLAASLKRARDPPQNKTAGRAYKRVASSFGMLRSYPDESSPSHQNWELKRR
jgi:hypothetical protein